MPEEIAPTFEGGREGLENAVRQGKVKKITQNGMELYCLPRMQFGHMEKYDTHEEATQWSIATEKQFETLKNSVFEGEWQMGAVSATNFQELLVLDIGDWTYEELITSS